MVTLYNIHDKRRLCKTLGVRDIAMKGTVDYICYSILFLGSVATARCYTVEKGVSEVAMLDALIGNLEDVRAGSQDMRGIIYAVLMRTVQYSPDSTYPDSMFYCLIRHFLLGKNTRLECQTIG